MYSVKLDRFTRTPESVTIFGKSVNQIRCRHFSPIFLVTYRAYPRSDALLSLNTEILAICPFYKNRKPSLQA